ncbi:MAG: hypothetical protein J5879_06035 [Clostridia bacterium]|nr:hypothetical protein [Clostridia bacterium]
MDKIKYIIALNGVKMSFNFKDALMRRISNSENEYRKKKSVTVTVTVCCCLFVLIVFASLFPVLLRSVFPHDPSVPPGVTDTVPGTGPVEPDPLYLEYVTAPSLYDGVREYDLFKAVTRYMCPTSDHRSIIVDNSLQRLKEFYPLDLSASAAAETFFAFYEKGSVTVSSSIADTHPDREFITIKEQLLEAERNEAEGRIANDLILMTYQNGTFEYLLTVRVYSAADGTGFYDGSGRYAGDFTDNGKTVMLEQSMIPSLVFRVFKIRFEYGVPVIYDTAVVSGIYQQEPPLTLNGDWSCISIIKGDGDALIGGAFYAGGRIFEMKCTENDMLGVTNVSGIPGYDYLYSFEGFKNLIGKRLLCEIINTYDLQWFFPIYTDVTGAGPRVIGEAVRCGTGAELTAILSSSSVLSSSSILSVIADDGVYRFPGTDITVSLYYSPSDCSDPRFDPSFFEDHPLYEIACTDEGGVDQSYGMQHVSYDRIYGSAAPETDSIYTSGTTGVFEFPYLVDTSDKDSLPLPFCTDLLRLAGWTGSISGGIYEFFDMLGVKLAIPGRITVNNSVCEYLKIRSRMIDVIYRARSFDVDEEGTEMTVVNGYERQGRYLIDMCCRVSGLSDGDLIYQLSESQRIQIAVVTDQNGGIRIVSEDPYVIGLTGSLPVNHGYDPSPFTVGYAIKKLGIQDGPVIRYEYGDGEAAFYLFDSDLFNVRGFGLMRNGIFTYRITSNLIRTVKNGKEDYSYYGDPTSITLPYTRVLFRFESDIANLETVDISKGNKGFWYDPPVTEGGYAK